MNWLDFFVIFLLLGGTVGIGVYLSRGSNSNVAQYLMASHSANPINVGLSIFVAFVSALSLTGYPSEVYLYGTAQLWNAITVPIIIAFGCYTIHPVFYRTRSDSVFDYVKIRFGEDISKICLVSSLLSWGFFVSAAILSPSYAIKAVLDDAFDLDPQSNMVLFLVIISMTVICIIYTYLGGMNAVIMADVINGFALIGATLVITIKLATTIGFSKITEVCERTKCNTMFSAWLESKEHFDLTYRSAPLIIVFRLLIDALITLPLQQAMAQRFNMCKNMKDGRIAMAIGGFCISLFLMMAVFIGVATLAFYDGRDALCEIPIRPDQIVPTLIIDMFRNTHGFQGLFLVAIFSATLSSFSSFLSGASLVMLPSVKSIFGTKYTDVTYCRIIMLFTGILTCLLSISMSFNPGTLLGILFMTTTNLGAPYFGTVLTGMFAPFVNRKGIIAGCFAPLFPLSIVILRKIFPTTTTYESNMFTNRSFNSSIDASNLALYCQNETFIDNIEPSPYWQQALLEPSTYAFGIYALLGFLIISTSVSYFTKKEDAPKYLTVYFKDGIDQLPEEFKHKTVENIKSESMTLLE
ncbi:Oidioi.mRNA.OKI2018_I69.chr1.g174.t1.cds [Oikopleura dioica]|uniref:Oidioi.mRNA.OKI2018_I69.chr1.g174.t1.cds n=1 Tax=Oikopleura dioica TaxID=34765 RepID=A0ABN7SJI5_OIKDI|nr:Oidioi.mRNA.OKI2018_I69.chr1.g174.t1.cds [Oikopleura dioica]